MGSRLRERPAVLGCLVMLVTTGLAQAAGGVAAATVPGENGKIAFVRELDGNSDIFVMDADGSNQVNLTNHPAGDFAPAWSPDGRRIAFTTGRDGNSEIYLINPDGTNLVNLTKHPAREAEPVWSPDGKHIAFVSDGAGVANGIFVMAADGTARTRLTRSEAAIAEFVQLAYPTELPPGRRMAHGSALPEPGSFAASE